ncbi:MAG: hypothetical protein L0958_04810 [Candidatus Mariimomonas ferrooxydans]
MCEENTSNSEISNPDNEAFWDEMQTTAQQAIEMIAELAEENEIDLDSLEVESVSHKFSRGSDKSDKHNLLQAAHGYLEITDVWFKSVFKEILNATNTAAADISDAVEIISWYRHQIFVKLKRAMIHDDSACIEEEDSMLPNDSDGSAKVALIGIDRSIGAWGKLQGHFKEKKNNILHILLHLDRLRCKAEQEFPDARNFKRPGFDTLS